MKGSPRLNAYLHLHFIVLIWGFTAILGLLISLSPVALVFYRTFLAAGGLALILYFQKQTVKLPVRKAFVLVGVGMILGLHWILFFASARVSTASVCLAGMSTSSLWTSLVDPLINRRRVKPLEVLLGLVALAGLYIVFRFEFDHAAGLLLSLASAFLAAVFVVLNSRLAHRYPAGVITFYEMTGAAAFSLGCTVLWQLFDRSKPQVLFPVLSDVPWILLLAGVCTVYAYTAGVALMRQFSAFMMNLTVNLEPVYGIVLAYLFFGEKEKMTPGFYVGTLVILCAVLAYPVLTRYVLKER